MKSTKPLPAAYIRVLELLKRSERISPELSARCGIRNVPNCIMTLRRQGHVIKTFRINARYAGKQYINIAEYQYGGFKSRTASEKLTSDRVRGLVKHTPAARRVIRTAGKVMGENLARLQLDKKIKK